jgi:hypothetical protein
MRNALSLVALFMVLLPAFADPVVYVSGQREIGPIVVDELTIQDGVLTFRTASGGGTDSSSFEVDVVQMDSVLGFAPHYELTIRRVRADYCKALFWDGVLIQIDLEAELGLTGYYTVTVTNPVYQGEPEES